MATTVAEPKSSTQPDAPAARDFRQEVTDRIINMLETGVAPWQKPWNPGDASAAMPRNPITDRNYRGGNAIQLLATALQRGYGDPRWMTYKQASEHGCQVRKGEKGTQIEFWEVKPANKKEGSPSDSPQDREGRDGESRRDTRLIHRVYTVFNATQIDGVPEYQPKRPTPFQVVSSGERILENSGAKITHDQVDRAFYSRSSDSIHLPQKESFKDAAGYYGTALHELAHWTGHPSRLDRPSLNASYRFGDTNYAKEELRAELASVFLAAERGIPHEPEQHAAYVGSWIKALQQDKNEIFRAAHDASAATDYLLALERDRSIAEESLAAGPGSDSNGSGTAILEEQTEKLARDREGAMEADATVRESTSTAVRVEPGSGTVKAENKQTGTERRSTIDLHATPPAQNGQSAPDDELSAARAVAEKALGNSARTVEALTESGAYRGPIIGETDQYVLQRQSPTTAILHPKHLLDRQLETGEKVAINYSNGKGLVRETRARGKTQEMSR
jgi:antirestriction protein ArdC